MPPDFFRRYKLTVQVRACRRSPSFLLFYIMNRRVAFNSELIKSCYTPVKLLSNVGAYMLTCLFALISHNQLSCNMKNVKPSIIYSYVVDVWSEELRKVLATTSNFTTINHRSSLVHIRGLRTILTCATGT